MSDSRKQHLIILHPSQLVFFLLKNTTKQVLSSLRKNIKTCKNIQMGVTMVTKFNYFSSICDLISL